MEEIRDKIIELIEQIDIEVGSTITFIDNQEKILSNMKSADLCVKQIMNLLEYN